MEPWEVYDHATTVPHHTEPHLDPDGRRPRKFMGVLEYVFRLLDWAGDNTAILAPPTEYPVDDYAIKEREAMMSLNRG